MVCSTLTLATSLPLPSPLHSGTETRGKKREEQKKRDEREKREEHRREGKKGGTETRRKKRDTVGWPSDHAFIHSQHVITAIMSVITVQSLSQPVTKAVAHQTPRGGGLQSSGPPSYPITRNAHIHIHWHKHNNNQHSACVHANPEHNTHMHNMAEQHGMPYNYVKGRGRTQNRKSPEEHQQNLCPVNTIGVVISETVPIPSYAQTNITLTAHYTGLVPILLPSPAVVCPHFHAYLTVTFHSCSHRPMSLGCIKPQLVLMRHTTRTAYHDICWLDI